MKKLALAALPLLLLLAVATPSCLAAENSASDQQPASQYSKLPPLHFSGSTLAQKEYLQAFLWMAQSFRQASTPKNEDEWLGISTTKATVLSSIAALIAAIMAPVISIFVARKTMAQTRESLEDDFTQRKREQKDNFKFQLHQLALEEKKKVMLSYFESTDIFNVISSEFSRYSLLTQLTMIQLLMDSQFYDVARDLLTFLDDNLLPELRKGPEPSVEIANEYKRLHTALSTEIKRVLSGEDFDPTLTASK